MVVAVRLEALEDFVTLARWGNFGLAARELHMSQPTLSKRIAALEKDVGFRLVERSPETALTAEGLAFLDFAQRTIADWRATIERCRNVSRAPKPLRLAWFNGDFLEDFLLGTDIPFEHVSFNHNLSLFSPLLSGQADALLFFDLNRYAQLAQEADRCGIACASVGWDRCWLAASKAGPLGEGGSADSSALRRCTMLVLNGVTFDAIRVIARDLLHDEDGELGFAMRPIGADSKNIQRIDFGSYLYLVNGRMVKRLLEARGDLAFFDAIDGEPIRMPFGVLVRRGDQNPLIGCLVEELRAYYAAQEEA